MAPTYAAYAAQAYLRNSSPVTIVRVLGAQHADVVDGGGGECVHWNVLRFGVGVGWGATPLTGRVAIPVGVVD